MKPITLLIADDHAIVRDSLRAILDFEADMVVCATARNGRLAVRLAEKHRPDVILMDIAMPGLNGIEATRQILRENDSARVIIISAHGEKAYLPRVIQAGALGYLLKDSSAEVLARAIREVHRGHAYFSPVLSKQLLGHSDTLAVLNDALAPLAGLSTRECEVIQLIAEGFSTKEIAGEIGVSCKTVEKHRQRLMEKLGIHNVAGLTRYATAHGVVDRGYRSARQLATA